MQNTGSTVVNKADKALALMEFDPTPLQDYANLWLCSHQQVTSCPSCWVIGTGGYCDPSPPASRAAMGKGSR
ncbi:hypothetical protein AAY473_040431 [Plecturocebus cupreus]